MELMQANRQWSSRPMDERFLSLTELHSHVEMIRQRSAQRVMPNRHLEAAPVDGDHKALMLRGPRGDANISHWAFGQLAQRAGAPAGYLRDLPSPLAADCINYGLRHARDVEDLGVILTRDDSGATTLRAATGPNYGRVWNSTVSRALVERFGDGRTGQWVVPGEFGRDVAITRQNTTLYASDRDLWVFLVDEKNRIEIPNRRNGQSGSLARGFFVWNSEVGAQTLGVATFLFDYVCANRIVWGATEYKEVKIRHTSGAPERFMEEVAPALRRMSDSGTHNVVAQIEAAKAARVDDIDEFLRKRFTRSQVTGIKAAHLADEGRPMETLWDITTGVTAYARDIMYNDERVTLERAGGAILDMA